MKVCYGIGERRKESRKKKQRKNLGHHTVFEAGITEETVRWCERVGKSRGEKRVRGQEIK